ncbi:MAG: hypothetical protein M1816_007898 [Peltula sp. TS41687]|nr:MAG: hypothetical protein M1816_007898 [Peltula sp. TS41687]
MSSSTRPPMIKEFHDTAVKDRLNTFFAAFMDGDAEKMKDCQAEDYVMDDYPLGALQCSRDAFFGAMSHFAPNTERMEFVPISLYGSSVVGNFAVFEYNYWFYFKKDMPEVAVHFGPNTKAGDKVEFVGVSVVWWNDEGKVKRHLEHARLVWEGFDVNQVKRM